MECPHFDSKTNLCGWVGVWLLGELGSEIATLDYLSITILTTTWKF